MEDLGLTVFLIPAVIILFVFSNKIRSVVPDVKEKRSAIIQNCVYLPNTGDFYDTPSRQLLDLSVGKNWYMPPDQPGVLYGQLPSGEISIRYMNPKNTTMS